ncbi:MAG: hypothetical protein J6T78_04085 [Bacteroidaceae bacterium]|nr:hypothetical protein [Bacteroidaceae bacterium]
MTMTRETVINAINAVEATYWSANQLTDDELDTLNDEIKRGLIANLLDTGMGTHRLNRLGKMSDVDFEAIIMRLVQDAVNTYADCAELVTDRKAIDIDAVCDRVVNKLF